MRLVLRTKDQSELLLSFHGIGHEYRGLLAGSVCFFRREEVDEGERELPDLDHNSDRFFQINHRESPAQAETRFNAWLQASLVRGLEVWRSGL